MSTAAFSATHYSGTDPASAVYLIDQNGNPILPAPGNQDGIVLLSSGYVVSNGTSLDTINSNGRGIKLFVATGNFGINASAITVTLQGKDPVSNTCYTILQSALLAANSFAVLSVYPGLAVVANASANDVPPRTFRVTWQASNWGAGGSVIGIGCAIIL